MKELRYKRRFSKSFGNKAAVITVPRSIAQAWEEHSTVDLVFNGDSLTITPCDENKQPSLMEMKEHDADVAYIGFDSANDSGCIAGNE